VQNGDTVVFNSDGTGRWGGSTFIRFGAVNGKLVIIYATSGNHHAIGYVFSNDGRTLLLSQTRENGITRGWILVRNN